MIDIDKQHSGRTHSLDRCSAQSCLSPGCSLERAEGHRWFCLGHRDHLAGVREELEAEMKRKGAYHRRGKGIKGALMQPTCCEIGCTEGRRPPALYCPDHSELEDA
jgi:hypothetical protein